VLLVKTTIAQNAQNWLAKHGFGPSLTRVLIRDTDPDNAPARGYAAILRCSPGERTVLAKKAESMGSSAFVFWSMSRKRAKQQAMQFMKSKGYRIKPRSE
jgi:hypothetical protein